MKQLVAGASHTCALFRDGAIKCWGDNSAGQLGIANTTTIGDNETPLAAPFVLVGGDVESLGSGAFTTCAVLSSGDLRCWGLRTATQSENIGDNETPQSAPFIDVGGPVAQVCGGDETMCARLRNGDVRCWGTNDFGALGVPGVSEVIDPLSVAPIDIGEPAAQLDCGVSQGHCAVTISGATYCWGFNPPSGRPGRPIVGDDETPNQAGPLVLGGATHTVGVGQSHACAVRTDGSLVCWGREDLVGYGLGTVGVIGDDEDPSSRGAVDLDALIESVHIGHDQTCAVTSSAELRCFGFPNGQSSELIGDNELPRAFAPLPFAAPVTTVATGNDHTCAALETGDVFCWGDASKGQLGSGNTQDIQTQVTSSGPVVLVTDQ